MQAWKPVLSVLVALIVAVLPTSTASAEEGGAGRYIVVLKDGAGSPAAVAADHARNDGARVGFVYSHALHGYSAVIPDSHIAQVRADIRVAYVERDQVVHAAAQQVPTGVQRIYAAENGSVADAAPNSNLDIDGIDDWRVDADVAVIDTGIDFDHPDLNVVGRTDCASGAWFSSGCTNNSGDDGNGHGSHVAGTIGALDNDFGAVGVAPGARLWAVRVLDNSGSGYMSWIAAGIDWVTARAGTIEVANMSLGCECSSAAMNDAIARSVDAGVVYAVAAGNSDKNASTFSPANHPDVITVSALADFNGIAGGGAAATCRADGDDTLADFSNWGSLVEIAAPGVCIYSTYKGGGYATLSGTSMASPHVAGAAALLASGASGDPQGRADVGALRAKLVAAGNLNWTDDSGDGVKEPLLDVSSTTVFQPTLVAPSSGGGSDPGGGTTEWNLTATVRTVRKSRKVDLAWAVAGAADPANPVEVWRNGAPLTTTTNDGGYTDSIPKTGTYYYFVCENDQNCSNLVTVA
jgi:subtilisin family serine protease